MKFELLSEASSCVLGVGVSKRRDVAAFYTVRCTLSFGYWTSRKLGPLILAEESCYSRTIGCMTPDYPYVGDTHFRRRPDHSKGQGKGMCEPHLCMLFQNTLRPSAWESTERRFNGRSTDTNKRHDRFDIEGRPECSLCVMAVCLIGWC